MVVNSAENDLNPLPEFFNQLQSFPWKSVGKRACGPTAVAMAINLLNKKTPNLPLVTPIEVLRRANDMNKLPGDKIQLRLHVQHPDGITDLITVGDLCDESLTRDIIEDKIKLPETFLVGAIPYESDYSPIYTLMRGWDHRGSERFFAEYGIRAEQFGDKNHQQKSMQEVLKSIQAGSMLLCSVKHSEDSSHIVLVTNYIEEDGTILIHDPLTKSPQWINAEEWSKEQFNGFGTIIFGKED